MPDARRLGWGRALWIELRPGQWVKNLFVLAPVFFSQQALHSEALRRAVEGAALFCAMSSSIYLLNDVSDRQQDRLHPEKRHRPVASGALPIWIAWVGAAALFAAALGGALAVSPGLAAILAGYWGLNALYSVRLKHLVIVDVFAVAAGYLLRVIGGAMTVGVEMSTWLLICTTLLALFIALCKRRHEVVLLEQEARGHRQVLADYPLPFLDMMIGVLTAAAVVSYTLYTVSGESVQRFHGAGLLLTVPFVLYGFFRYLYLVYHKAEGGDPTQSLLTDRAMLINLVLWAAATGMVLYG